MKAVSRVFAGLFLLLVPFAVIYGIGTSEQAGNVLFVGFLAAFAFLAVFGWRGPDDEPDATPSDGAGEDLGVFPARSVWPLTIAAGATLLAFGLAFNAWIALPGLLLLLTAVMGFALETRP